MLDIGRLIFGWYRFEVRAKDHSEGEFVIRKAAPLLWISCLLGSSTSAYAAEITHEQIEEGGIISIQGEIQSGDAEKFRQVSVNYPKAVVVLESEGGSLLPAIEIGKIIKIAGFITVVPPDSVCASSCALIWLAGEPRALAETGHVGFHASYRDNNGSLEESGVANALIGNYLGKLNLSERAIVFATSAAPDEIMWLTKANKDTAGIDFENFETGEEHGSVATASPPPIQVRVAPPPIRTAAPARASTLPPSLPASLSQVRSEWIQYARNGFYDASSITLIKDINGNLAGRRFWTVLDRSGDKGSKIAYSLVQLFIYCPDETVAVYQWTDYTRDGRPKIREVPHNAVPAKPGSGDRLLVDDICR